MVLSRSLMIDSVSRLALSPHRITPDQPVSEAIDRMKEQNVGCLVVCEAGRLVGILTERDLMIRVIARGLALSIHVGECMTPDPVTVALKESIRAAVDRMQQGNYRHLPVLDEQGELVGILSIKS